MSAARVTSATVRVADVPGINLDIIGEEIRAELNKTTDPYQHVKRNPQRFAENELKRINVFRERPADRIIINIEFDDGRTLAAKFDLWDL